MDDHISMDIEDIYNKYVKIHVPGQGTLPYSEESPQLNLNPQSVMSKVGHEIKKALTPNEKREFEGKEDMQAIETLHRDEGNNFGLPTLASQIDDRRKESGNTDGMLAAKQVFQNVVPKHEQPVVPPEPPQP